MSRTDERQRERLLSHAPLATLARRIAAWRTRRAALAGCLGSGAHSKFYGYWPLWHAAPGAAPTRVPERAVAALLRRLERARLAEAGTRITVAGEAVATVRAGFQGRWIVETRPFWVLLDERPASDAAARALLERLRCGASALDGGLALAPAATEVLATAARARLRAP